MGFYAFVFCVLGVVTGGFCATLCTAQPKPNYELLVQLTRDVTPGNYKAIVFNSIKREIGGPAYNKTNGVFTAPVDGMYFFDLKICSDGDWDEAAIMKEGVIIAQPSAHDMGCGSDSGATSLKAGDQVWCPWIRGHHRWGGTVKAYHGVYFRAVLIA